MPLSSQPSVLSSECLRASGRRLTRPRDKDMESWVGRELLAQYLAVKEKEAETFGKMTDEERRQKFLNFFGYFYTAVTLMQAIKQGFLSCEPLATANFP